MIVSFSFFCDCWLLQWSLLTQCAVELHWSVFMIYSFFSVIVECETARAPTAIWAETALNTDIIWVHIFILALYASGELMFITVNYLLWTRGVVFLLPPDTEVGVRVSSGSSATEGQLSFSGVFNTLWAFPIWILNPFLFLK